MVRDEDVLARALRDLNLACVSKFTLKPEQESVVTALSAGRTVYDSFACRTREKSNLSNVCSCPARELNGKASVLVISP